MQVIYAAPFILLSLIAFVCCLVIRRLRPCAFRALVAPVAFGFCSIVSMGLILLTAHVLGLQFANYPLVGVRGLIEGMVIYFIPGLAGAWIAVEIVRQFETRVLNTQSRREFAIRAVVALMIFGPVFIVLTGVQFKMFPRTEEWWPLCLALSALGGLLASTLTYLLVGTMQKRMRVEMRRETARS